MLWTRVGLFLGFGLLMGGAVAANMVIAYRARPFHRPDSPEQTGLDRYRDAVAPIRTLLLVSVAGVIGLFGGVAANGKWRDVPAVGQPRAVPHRRPLLPQGRRLLRLHAAVAALRGRAS